MDYGVICYTFCLKRFVPKKWLKGRGGRGILNLIYVGVRSSVAQIWGSNITRLKEKLWSKYCKMLKNVGEVGYCNRVVNGKNATTAKAALKVESAKPTVICTTIGKGEWTYIGYLFSVILLYVY